MTGPGETGSGLRIERDLPAPPSEVYAAWTDPDHLKLWMCPGDGIVRDAEADVRPGGHFRVVMRFDHHDYEHGGTYVELSEPRRLTFTWFSSATEHRETLVVVELGPAGDDTHLVLTHARLPEGAVADHEEGWSSMIDKLAARLSRP